MASSRAARFFQVTAVEDGTVVDAADDAEGVVAATVGGVGGGVVAAADGAPAFRLRGRRVGIVWRLAQDTSMYTRGPVLETQGGAGNGRRAGLIKRPIPFQGRNRPWGGRSLSGCGPAGSPARSDTACLESWAVCGVACVFPLSWVSS